MLTLSSLELSDVDEVIARVRTVVADTHHVEPLVSDDLDETWLWTSLTRDLAATTVARRDGHVVGHLSVTRVDGAPYGRSAWVNPGAVSYDDVDVLAALFNDTAARLIADDVSRHYVWLAVGTDLQVWLELGFSFMHRRGAMELVGLRDRPLDGPLRIRRATMDDLESVLRLDAALHDHQLSGPSFSIGFSDPNIRDEWIETLEDEEVTVYLVERDGVVVAQCSTYEMPTTVGVAPGSVHLSAVSVAPDERGRGTGTALVTRALTDAREAGFHIAQTNWRVTNWMAARYWLRFGFRPTFVRLRRELDES